MVTIYGTQDVMLRRADPNNNYGGCNYWQYVTTGTIDVINMISFDMSSINPATLTAATYNYYITDEGTNNTFTYRVHRVTSTFVNGTACGSFQAGTATHNNQPTIGSSVQESHTGSSSDRWESVNILGLMQAETTDLFTLYTYLGAPLNDYSTIRSMHESNPPYISYTGGEFPTSTQINIGDTWRDVDGIQINIGDSWKDVVGVQQNIGDTWKTVF